RRCVDGHRRVPRAHVVRLSRRQVGELEAMDARGPDRAGEEPVRARESVLEMDDRGGGRADDDLRSRHGDALRRAAQRDEDRGGQRGGAEEDEGDGQTHGLRFTAMAQVAHGEHELRRVIDEDRELEGVGEQELIELYRSMVLLRTYDERSLVYHRQGRIGTYAIFWNHEAMQAGSAHALEDGDWIFPSYRESAIGLLRGMP